MQTNLPLTLTSREYDCIILWMHHKTMKKAGQALGISHRTVQSHCYSAMKKLSIHKKQDLFAFIRSYFFLVD